jgi:hypothetical protein
VARHSDFGGLPPAVHIDVTAIGGSHEQEIYR